MKKVLSVIFIILCIMSISSCGGRPAHEIDETAVSEFKKTGMSEPIIESSALCGFSDKAIAFYEAYDGDITEVIALEFDMKGENDYSFVTSHTPENYADGIYILSWERKSIAFVTNKECAVMTVDENENGVRVDKIKDGTHPYITAEEGESEFHFYTENMTEIR